jgi:predicted transcriptional regulator
MINDHELMFELSHPSRLKALQILKEKPHRLTDISKVLDLTSAEISRHLGRLSDANLISKNGDGKYILTPFGDVILFELTKLKFLTKHNRYFSNHDLSIIPDELHWLNAMSKSEMVEGTLEIMSMVEDLTKNARRYVHLISGSPMRAVADLTVKTAQSGIEFKMLYQKGSDIPGEYKVKKNVPLEVRVIDSAPFSLKLNEKQGGFVLPDMKGKVDFGFALMGSDPQFLKWLGLLFDYYWQKAEPAF